MIRLKNTLFTCIMLLMIIGIVTWFSPKASAADEYLEVDIAQTASNVWFTDEDSDFGKIGGKLYWSPSEDEAQIKGYAVYYLNSSGKKLQFITQVAAGSQYRGRGSYIFIIKQGTPIPEGAMQIGVFAQNDTGVAVHGSVSRIWDLPAYSISQIQFIDMDPQAGKILGSLKYGLPSNDSKIGSYVLNWLDASGKIISVMKEYAKGEKLAAEITEQIIPKDAVYIQLQAKDTDGFAAPESQKVLLYDNITTNSTAESNPGDSFPSATDVTFFGVKRYSKLWGSELFGSIEFEGAKENRDITGYEFFLVNSKGVKIGELAEIKANSSNRYDFTIQVPYVKDAVGIGVYSKSGQGESKAFGVASLWIDSSSTEPQNGKLLSVEGKQVSLQWDSAKDESHTTAYQVQVVYGGYSYKNENIAGSVKAGSSPYTYTFDIVPHYGTTITAFNIIPVDTFGHSSSSHLTIQANGKITVQAPKPIATPEPTPPPETIDHRPMAEQMFAPKRKVKESVIQVFVDGEPVQFAANPLLLSNTTFVQFRPIFEKLGLSVSWDGATRTVKGDGGGTKVELNIDSSTARINGEIKALDVAPKIYNDVTFVPLRLIGEATGRKVIWDGNLNAVYIIKQDSFKTLHYDDGSLKYEGQMENGMMNGKGKLYKPGGILWYDAEFVNDEVRGQGTIFYYGMRGDQLVTGDKVIGQFIQGMPEGFGQYYIASGQLRYEGQFKAGRPDGVGQYYTNDVLQYDGEWKDNKYSGNGKLYVNGRIYYEGQFADNQRNGQGKFYLSDGHLTYEGGFKDDQFDGEGTFYYESNRKYIGAWVKNNKQGKGKMYDNLGNLEYDGDYNQGFREKKGTLYFPDGTKYEGALYSDYPSGQGKLTDKDGKILYEGDFKNGQPVNSTIKLHYE